MVIQDLVVKILYLKFFFVQDKKIDLKFVCYNVVENVYVLRLVYIKVREKIN